MKLDPTKPDPLDSTTHGAVEKNIERLREEGCRFPILRHDLVRGYKNVGEATLREMARRGLVKCGEIWDGSLSGGLAHVVEGQGITSRADFREKYTAGKLNVERWRNVGRHKLNLLLKWAGLPPLVGRQRPVKYLLGADTCAEMDPLIRERQEARDAELFAKLVAECELRM